MFNDIVLKYQQIAEEKDDKYRQHVINASKVYSPNDTWNLFSTKYKRTNYLVDGDNNKMKQFCGTANLIHILIKPQHSDATSTDTYRNENHLTNNQRFKTNETIT